MTSRPSLGVSQRQPQRTLSGSGLSQRPTHQRTLSQQYLPQSPIRRSDSFNDQNSDVPDGSQGRYPTAPRRGGSKLKLELANDGIEHAGFSESPQNLDPLSASRVFTPSLWLKDLANPSISLRRLSRTIPHGIRGRVLLDQCLNKNVPTDRAVWLAKCVGANEIRAFKRKGVNGTFVMGGETKWIRDWTVNVEQFVETVSNSFSDDDWKAKVTYASSVRTQPAMRSTLVKALDNLLRMPNNDDMAAQLWKISDDKSGLIRTVLEWCTSLYRSGVAKVYVAATVFRSWSTFDVDITGSILNFLDTDPLHEPSRKRLVYHLVSELVRSGHYSVPQYLQWLIARGGLCDPYQTNPDGPCGTRLLVELPTQSLSDSMRSLRATLLRRASYLVEDEANDIATAIKCIKYALSIPLEADDPIMWKKPMSIKKLAQRVGLSSRALRSEVCSWLSHDIVWALDMNFQSGKGGLQLSSIKFEAVRTLLEKAQDFTMLAHFLRVVSKTSNADILGQCADAISLHLPVFAATGAAKSLFECLYDRLKALAEEQGLGVRPLLAALANLAPRLPGFKDVASQLRNELIRTDRSNAVDASSPLSDNMAVQLQDHETELNEQIEKLASYSSADRPTMERLFQAIVRRYESCWSKADERQRPYCMLLTRLRVFDPQHFDMMMRALLVPDGNDGQKSFEQVLELANEFTLPFCQVKLSLNLATDDASGADGPERIQSQLELLSKAMDNAIDANNVMWTGMLSRLTPEITQHLKGRAELRFLELLPSLRNQSIAEGALDADFHMAENLLTVIDSTIRGTATPKPSPFSSSMVDKLADIWEILASTNPEHAVLKADVLSRWLPLVLSYLALLASLCAASATDSSAASKVAATNGGEVRGRALLVLAGLVQELDNGHFSSAPSSNSNSLDQNRATALGQRAFDIALIFADGLPEDARQQCARAVRDATSDPRLRYLFSFDPPSAAGAAGSSSLMLAQREKLATTNTPGQSQSQEQQQQQQRRALAAANMAAMMGIGGVGGIAPERLAPFQLRRWEILSEPTPNVGENDTSLSLTLFDARKL
ncbi:putative rna polymerase i activation mediator protein [Eutypa lata UCREL1]|uniref:Mediator of RNA polymerase II transcription subunit 12 n=1 Tax=Eutypa lata (strain UCR-EL1) TaxID=1287681 RepID=M7SHJ9_EUTLA|nr:putative rna polymerase i activation mediator protein [Eutypa lata UCREL1]